ncbi:MAG: 2'-5' RNA ligase family protein [Candidatus Krumholzibacteria bacterium]|nr:2'-5' RNA ligase family protein [Candidatus Krumholzibacteria bacterium]
MKRYIPFIDDAEHLARLEGQRYIVLRPNGSVPELWVTCRSATQARLAGHPVSYPASPHVTLTGFPAGTPLRAIRDLVLAWAPAVGPLRIEVEGCDFFPPPFQVLILRALKTPELFGALARLRRAAVQQGLPDWPAISPEDWIFHMSIAYCEALDPAVWEDVSRFVRTLDAPRIDCTVTEVEIVAFDERRERSGGTFGLMTDVE